MGISATRLNNPAYSSVRGNDNTYGIWKGQGTILFLVMAINFLFHRPMGVGPISYAVAGLMVDVNLSLLFAGAGVLLFIITLLSATNREIRELA
ncbi:MAG: hypothetical protein ABI690_22545 [Chloroflexota bacterium]